AVAGVPAAQEALAAVLALTHPLALRVVHGQVEALDEPPEHLGGLQAEGVRAVEVHVEVDVRAAALVGVVAVALSAFHPGEVEIDPGVGVRVVNLVALVAEVVAAEVVEDGLAAQRGAGAGVEAEVVTHVGGPRRGGSVVSLYLTRRAGEGSWAGLHA